MLNISRTLSRFCSYILLSSIHTHTLFRRLLSVECADVCVDFSMVELRESGPKCSSCFQVEKFLKSEEKEACKYERWALIGQEEPWRIRDLVTLGRRPEIIPDNEQGASIVTTFTYNCIVVIWDHFHMTYHIYSMFSFIWCDWPSISLECFLLWKSKNWGMFEGRPTRPTSWVNPRAGAWGVHSAPYLRVSIRGTQSHLRYRDCNKKLGNPVIFLSVLIALLGNQC